LFFHINSKECTMLSSKLTITDLFNNSMYPHLTEKSQPRTVSIYICPPRLDTVGTDATCSTTHVLRLLQHPKATPSNQTSSCSKAAFALH
jgi:hypothetical protein